MVALSFFDDRYALEHCGTSASNCAGTLVALDETAVTLDADKDVWKRLKKDGSAYFLQLRSGASVRTWLPDDPKLVEHFKVWSRQPASTVVRNLWATSQAGLKAGVYRLHITRNDGIWDTSW